MELELRRRLNKSVGDQIYWKWYIDVPADFVKELKLKLGDKLDVNTVK